ncbi:Abi family protein [Corynebacterium casei]|uniref:Abi family protein n=1 Tax=Corynebacterium casei TaxID=160386 RepID=UPI0023F0F7C2|nr:Abi family protein [Corynebacterium casei]
MKTKAEIDRMLGAARFIRYLNAADQNLEKAIQLYRWNTQLAGAIHSQLSHFEVLTRNSMDLVLQEWNYQACGYRGWSLEHQTGELLHEMFKRPLAQARRRAANASKHRTSGHRRKNAPLTHDDVIAQLSLGNWANLLGEALPAHRQRAQVLWQEGLHKAFPRIQNSDASRKEIGKRIERLTRLRNRVSHQENLLETNIRHRLNDMLSVLQAIDNTYPAWAITGSQLRQVAQHDPRRSWK